MNISKLTKIIQLNAIPPKRAFEVARGNASIQGAKRVLDVITHLSSDEGVLRKIKLPTGQEMYLKLPESVSMHLYLRVPFEPEVTTFMNQILKEGMIVYDLGAHMGYFTLLSREAVGSSGRVVAFEPVSESYEILTLNCRTFSNIKLENCAINDGSTSETELQFYGLRLAAQTTGWEPRLRKFHERAILEPERRIVPATSIDSYVATSGYVPDLVKIDIEGGEMDALIGAESTIREHSPCIIMEIGDGGRSEYNSTFACLRFLEELGYGFYTFDPKLREIKTHTPRRVYNGNGNLLCVSKDYMSPISLNE